MTFVVLEGIDLLIKTLYPFLGQSMIECLFSLIFN